MKIEETSIEGLCIIRPTVHRDKRGYFMESYSERKFYDAGLDITFVQDNEAYSQQGAVRGLHYQLNPHAQTKLVRVVEGSVLDVVIDIRPDSATYGKLYTIELSAENKTQLLIPKGLAHGYATLSDYALFIYKCDAYYAPDYEAGIDLLDEKLGIDWGLDVSDMIISDKDKKWPKLGNHKEFL